MENLPSTSISNGVCVVKFLFTNVIFAWPHLLHHI